MEKEQKTDIMPGLTSRRDAQGKTRGMGDDYTGGRGLPAGAYKGETLQGKDHRFIITETLDITSGGEADLYLCKIADTDKETGATYIAKIYRDVRNIDLEIRDKLLSFLNNPDLEKDNIMPILDYGKVGDTIFDVMPYMEQGDLGGCGAFDFKELLHNIIPQLNEALHSIHEAGFIHRDIKPKNLYMSRGGKVIVGDFGIASENVSKVNPTSGRGTDGYRAPEIKLHAATQKTDYFSLGVTIATLYNGEEIFADSSVYDIGYSIVRGDLPLNIKKEDRDLKVLLDGLIEMNPKQRFGYEEVKMWCENPGDKRLIERVKMSASKSTYSSVYSFLDGKYNDPETLSKALAYNWDRACDHLYSGKLEKFFDKQNQELAMKANDIVYRDCKHNRDLGLYRFLYHLNSDAPLRWRGKEYGSLSEIAEIIYAGGDEIDRDIQDLITEGAISWRIKQEPEKVADDKVTLKEIEDIEGLAQGGRAGMAYYLYMYQCAPGSGYFPLGDNKVRTMDELFDCMAADVGNFYVNCDRLLSSPRFYGFVASLGYQGIALELLGLLGDDPVENYNSLMRVFERTVSDKRAVSRYYINYGTKSYLYWIQQNLNIYDFNDKEARALRKDIRSIKLDDTMTLSEIDNAFQVLQKYVMDLKAIFNPNIFLAYIGIHGEDNRAKASIYSTNSDAFFIYNFFGTAVPAGFKRYITRGR